MVRNGYRAPPPIHPSIAADHGTKGRSAIVSKKELESIVHYDGLGDDILKVHLEERVV
jgi:hypothetical protein